MLRFTLKFPYHGLPRFQKYGSSRLLSVSYPQESNVGPASSSNDKRRSKSGGGGKGIFYTIGVLSVATGATLVYAKNDSEFRKWLNTQVPWSEPVLEVVFQEKGDWSVVLQDILKGISQRTHQLISGISTKEDKKEIPGGKEEKPEFTPPRSVFSALLSRTQEPKEKPWAEIRVLPESSNGPQKIVPVVERKTPDKPDPATLPETHPLNLVDLEKKIKESSSVAVNSYHEAASAVREISLDILTLVEQSVEQTDQKGLQKVKAKIEKKDALLKEAEKEAQYAIDNLRKLKGIITESENLDAPESMKAAALRNIDRVMEDISTAKEDLEKERKNASMAEKYWNKVKEARKHYTDELLTLFPDVRISEKDWRINKQDLDLFIYHCFQNVLYFQKELAKLETLRAEKLDTALKICGTDGKVDKALVDATISDALERQRIELELTFQKKILEVQQTVDREMRIQLKRQTEAHNDHLCDVIVMREKEMERKFLHQQEEQLAAEQDKYKHQLAGMLGRLQGLESALKARAHIDKGAHQAQVLWSACQALHCALKHTDPAVPWQEQVRPLGNEIAAVQKAAMEDDELVKAVLEGIPCEAWKRGVFSESALRERFLHVETAARHVALVPKEGASLPVYVLSYLQSGLLLKAINPIPQSELCNEPQRFDQMDTYDVLQRARYWMERGNIEQTLRYMNLLCGASRAVAQDWMTEARIFLETKQAATVLMTHAAAAGLLYV